jgi:hypothetical protein
LGVVGCRGHSLSPHRVDARMAGACPILRTRVGARVIPRIPDAPPGASASYLVSSMRIRRRSNNWPSARPIFTLHPAFNHPKCEPPSSGPRKSPASLTYIPGFGNITSFIVRGQAPAPITQKTVHAEGRKKISGVLPPLFPAPHLSHAAPLSLGNSPLCFCLLRNSKFPYPHHLTGKS